MGHRLSKIYTKTGDQGTTGLGDGSRVSKSNERIVALGDIDELNAHMGLLRAHIAASPLSLTQHEQWRIELSFIQHQLFDLGGEICIPHSQLLKGQSIEQLERQIDRMNAQLPMLKEFILPAGVLCCAQAHVARAVCRRAERSLVILAEHEQNVQATSLQFINRLSDWLFVASRLLQKQNSGVEVLWERS